MSRMRSLAGLLLLIPALNASAVELEDILQALLGQALTVTITARLTQDGEETVQSYQLTRITISGRAVRLRLEGGNLTIIAEFTPYEGEDKSILLVAEGQMWLRSPEREEVQYRTSFGSVPLEFGESALFYPLGRSAIGMDVENDRSGRLNIELEVQIEPYQAEQG